MGLFQLFSQTRCALFPGTHGSDHHGSTSAAGMGGHGSAKCSFKENMDANNQRYTIDNIKTDEEGVWKFVFDKDAMIEFNIVGANAPASQSFTCTQKQTTTECTSGASNPPIPAGTYTIEVKSPTQTGPVDFSWESTPMLTTYFVGDKDYCEGEIFKYLGKRL